MTSWSNKSVRRIFIFLLRILGSECKRALVLYVVLRTPLGKKLQIGLPGLRETTIGGREEVETEGGVEGRRFLSSHWMGSKTPLFVLGGGIAVRLCLELFQNLRLLDLVLRHKLIVPLDDGCLGALFDFHFCDLLEVSGNDIPGDLPVTCSLGALTGPEEPPGGGFCKDSFGRLILIDIETGFDVGVVG